MKFSSDIDIDLADRDSLLGLIRVTPAAIRTADAVKKHNTGVHPTAIPVDPVNGVAALDYNIAEDRGYVKIDLLNIWVYKHVKDEAHLRVLMRDPDWSKLQDPDFFARLIHIGKHYAVAQQMPEPINSIPRLAMFLSIIRPGKRYLIGRSWGEVAKEIWSPDPDGLYYFKKSHAVAYAHLVAVNMNLLVENPTAFSSQE